VEITGRGEVETLRIIIWGGYNVRWPVRDDFG
jgi:hypothetical protein